jgi:hypothetical protein
VANILKETEAMKHLTGAILLSPLFFTTAAQADSINNLSGAIGDSAEASAQVVAAGGQVAIGAVALPLSVVGSGAEMVGGASQDLADELWDAANAPLIVDQDVVIAVPPPPLKAKTEGARN